MCYRSASTVICTAAVGLLFSRHFLTHLEVDDFDNINIRCWLYNDNFIIIKGAEDKTCFPFDSCKATMRRFYKI